MSKLSILLFKSFVGPFVVTFAVAIFMFEMQFIWVYLDDLVGKELGFWVIFKLLAYASARLINMALPLAILMSSMMCMGNMSEYSELTAMKSAGVSLMRVMRPLVVLSFVLGICAFLVANNLWPTANLKFRSLMYSVLQQRPALNLPEGIFYNGIEGISMRVKKNNHESGELEDVIIYDHRDARKANKTVIRAERGMMQETSDKRYLVFTLYNGHMYDEQLEKKKAKQEPNYPMISGAFDEMTMRLDLSSFMFKNDKEEMFKNQFDMMSVGQLVPTIDSLEMRLDSTRYQSVQAQLRLLKLRDSTSADTITKSHSWFFSLLKADEQVQAISKGKDAVRRKRDQVTSDREVIGAQTKYLNRHKIELHRKFYFAFSCVVMFFIGAPLGAIIRKGGLGLPTVVAIIFFIFYLLLATAGEKMARSGILVPWMGMWLSSIVIFPLAIYLTRKASQDGFILNSDSMLKRVARFFRRKKNSELRIKN